MRDERIRELGFNVKIERMRKKISQLRLAEMANVSMVTIQKIEYGKQTPSALVLYDIANALQVPIETFYEGVGTQK
ncbi:helix-turn-helix transcriptional regulator [bacterium]|nr:helix-turn-helix transcriptional regulator [bacterium]